MLSFLVPAYNCDDTVTEAVESALAQRVDEQTEIVVVDDCSTDGTYAVLQELAAREAGVRVYRHGENRGGGPARNTAAASASGQLFYILDADNVLPPGCVQRQLNVLRQRDAAAVSVATVQFFDGHTGVDRHRWELAHEDRWSALRQAFEALEVPAAHGNYLFTRHLFESVGGYEEDLDAMDAWTFGFKHLAHGFPVAIATGAHYRHRIDRPGRASYWTREQQKGSNDRNALSAIRHHRDRLPPDLRAKVDLLDADDPFFAVVADGGFERTVSSEEFDRRLERLRDEGRRSVVRRLRARIGRAFTP